MQILFVTDFSPIVTNAAASRRFYIDTLGLPLEGTTPASEKVPGVKHFGLWPLRDAACDFASCRDGGAARETMRNQFKEKQQAYQ